MPKHITIDKIGIAGGIAPLGTDSKVPADNLPAGQGGITLEQVKADTDIADSLSKKHSNTLDHEAGSDNQDISGKVDKVTGSSLVIDSEISKIHSSGSDNQDLSGLEPKQIGKSLSTNDLTAELKSSYDGAVTHAGTAHAPSTAQKNSDITKAEIEAKLTGELTSHSHAGGGSPPAWKGSIAGAWDDGSPADLLDMMLNNPINATPTGIAITVARCAFFTLDTQLVVNKIRWFGVGATTLVYHVAIYRLSDLVRITADLNFTTVAQAWGSIAAGPVTLEPNIIYFIAVSADTIGTTAGVQCMSSTTGRIGILPTNWPGNLKINLVPSKIGATGFCQFAVTAGVLPNPANTLALQAAWAGGMPAFFLDNNNA